MYPITNPLVLVTIIILLGVLVCGVINREVPRHVAVGNAIQNSLLLVSSCSNGDILVSEHIRDTLADQGEFELSFYRRFVGRVGATSCCMSFSLSLPHVGNR